MESKYQSIIENYCNNLKFEQAKNDYKNLTPEQKIDFKKYCENSVFQDMLKDEIILEVDLLENYHLLPIEVQNILLNANDQDDYNTCEETIKKLELHGYTADYDLNGCLFDLKKL